MWRVVGFIVVGWYTVIGTVLLVADSGVRLFGLFLVLTGLAWFAVDTARRRQRV